MSNSHRVFAGVIVSALLAVGFQVHAADTAVASVTNPGQVAVRFDSLASALAAAQNGAYVSLKAPCDGVIAVPAGKTIYFDGGENLFSGSFAVSGALKIRSGKFASKVPYAYLDTGIGMRFNNDAEANSTWSAVKAPMAYVSRDLMAMVTPQPFPDNLSAPIDVAYQFNAYENADDCDLMAQVKRMSDSHGDGRFHSEDFDDNAVERARKLFDDVYPFLQYHADFFVTFDKPVAEGSLKLVGQYKGWSDQWMPIAVPEDIAASRELRLLGGGDLTIKFGNMSIENTIDFNYSEILTKVGQFNCGIINMSTANIGTKMKVELRIMEPGSNASGFGEATPHDGETGRYICVGEYEYTIGVPAEVVDDKGLANAMGVDAVADVKLFASESDKMIAQKLWSLPSDFDPMGLLDESNWPQVMAWTGLTAGEFPRMLELLAERFRWAYCPVELAFGFSGADYVADNSVALVMPNPLTGQFETMPLAGGQGYIPGGMMFSQVMDINFLQCCIAMGELPLGIVNQSGDNAGTTIDLEFRLSLKALAGSDEALAYVVSQMFPLGLKEGEPLPEYVVIGRHSHTFAAEKQPVAMVGDVGYSSINDAFVAAIGAALQSEETQIPTLQLCSDLTLPADIAFPEALQENPIPMMVVVTPGVTLDVAGHDIGKYSMVMVMEGGSVRGLETGVSVTIPTACCLGSLPIPAGTLYFGSLAGMSEMVYGMAEALGPMTIDLEPAYTGYPQAWTSINGGDSLSKNVVDVSYSFYAFNPTPDVSLGYNDEKGDYVSEDDLGNVVFDYFVGSGQNLNPSVNYDEIRQFLGSEYARAMGTPAQIARVAEMIDQLQPFGDWIADFEVTFSKPVKAGSLSVTGYYEAYDLGMTFPLDRDMEPSDHYRLMFENPVMSVQLPYAAIFASVRKFICGVKNLSPENNGTTMSVTLHLYPPVDDQANAPSILIGRYDYVLTSPQIQIQANEGLELSDAAKATIIGNEAVTGFKDTNIQAAIAEGDAFGLIGLLLTDVKVENDVVGGAKFDVIPVAEKKVSKEAFISGETEGEESEYAPIPYVTTPVTVRLPVDAKSTATELTVVCTSIAGQEVCESLGTYPVQSESFASQKSTDGRWHDKNLFETTYKYIELTVPADAENPIPFPVTVSYGLVELPDDPPAEQEPVVIDVPAEGGESSGDAPTVKVEVAADDYRKIADSLSSDAAGDVQQAVAEKIADAVQEALADETRTDVLAAVSDEGRLEKVSEPVQKLETGKYTRIVEATVDVGAQGAVKVEARVEDLALVNNQSVEETVVLPVPAETKLSKAIATEPTDGDAIFVYDVKQKGYRKWTYSQEQKKWNNVNVEMIGGTAVVNDTPAEEMTLPAGSVIKYEKADSSKNVAILTKYDENVSSTPQEVPEAGESAKWNLMANPTGKDFEVQNIQGDNTDADKIVVLATDGLGQRELKKNKGEWGYWKNELNEKGRVKKTWVPGGQIKAGQTMWYISNGGKPTIEWNK